MSEDWYLGTANAVYQNLYSVEKSGAEHVLVLAADHVYKMDYRRMLAFHRDHGGPVTVATLRGPGGRGGRAVRGGRGGRRRRVSGVPGEAGAARPGPRGRGDCLASMGIYVFTAPFLIDELRRNAEGADPGHDFGQHILPALIGREPSPGVHLLRPGDRGTRVLAGRGDGGRVLPGEHGPAGRPAGAGPVRQGVADLQLPAELPTAPSGRRPRAARRDRPRGPGTTSSRTGRSSTGGCGGRWSGSTAGSRRGAVVEDSILFDRACGRPGAEVRRAILDKGVQVRPGARVGVDPDEDRARGFVVSEGGVTCVPKDVVVEAASRALER